MSPELQVLPIHWYYCYPMLVLIRKGPRWALRAVQLNTHKQPPSFLHISIVVLRSPVQVQPSWTFLDGPSNYYMMSIYLELLASAVYHVVVHTL